VCLLAPAGVRASTLAAPSKAAVQLQIALYVFNYAQVPSHTLRAAEKETAGIFSHAKIGIDWEEVNLQANDSSRCAVEFKEQPCCMLRIQARLANGMFTPRTAGYALHGTPYATIIFDAVAEEAKSVARSQSMVLGHTIAHEVAHLFLPPGYHSSEGIMQEYIDEKV